MFYGKKIKKLEDKIKDLEYKLDSYATGLGNLALEFTTFVARHDKKKLPGRRKKKKITKRRK